MKAKRRLTMLASLALALVLAAPAAAQRSIAKTAGGGRSSSYAAPSSGLRAYGHRRDLRSTRYGHRGSIRSTSYGRRERYAPARTWVPGHYSTVRRNVWVPARTESVWIEPAYDVRCNSRGVSVRVLVREGHYRDVLHPGHYESRAVQVWVPGHWSESTCRT